jgi:hypothetical protein
MRLQELPKIRAFAIKHDPNIPFGEAAVFFEGTPIAGAKVLTKEVHKGGLPASGYHVTLAPQPGLIPTIRTDDWMDVFKLSMIIELPDGTKTESQEIDPSWFAPAVTPAGEYAPRKPKGVALEIIELQDAREAGTPSPWLWVLGGTAVLGLGWWFLGRKR